MTAAIIAIGVPVEAGTALRRLIERLPATPPVPVLVTRHGGGPDPFPAARGTLPAGCPEALEPTGPEPLEPGRIYLAPADRHLIVAGGEVRASQGPQENLERPAIDAMFRSVALAYGPLAIGVLLAGRHEDGVAGLLAIADHGGTTLVQDAGATAASTASPPAFPDLAFGHRCDLQSMPSLIEAAIGRVAAGEPACAADEIVATENVIASGNLTFADWLRFEHMVQRSGLVCPACGGALQLLPDRRIVRFRCCCGRAFSARTLARVAAEERRAALEMLADAARHERALDALLAACRGDAGPAPAARAA